MQQRARAAWQAGESQYKCCIVEEGGSLVSRHSAQHGYDTTPSALRHARQLARHGLRQGPVLRYKLCIVTGGPTTRQRARATQPVRTRHGQCAHDTASAHYNTASARCNTAGLGYDTTLVRATTQPSAHCDTALCMRPGCSVRSASAQPGPWVCALCTRPSFDSVHYSE